ncbi:transporter substrate-binding domain-containing protein [Pelomonas sp. CA6]|uniref:substrate-binding periplasmic protein n=1 Tax=Pelomonas sp. CA6 TaxID=2907999 RepID=UPI001F4B84CC|nr:transporter substrate-binding domain-containing protein [Pelomonas sp. CA6]MCH7342731.1 transporter substrate-binding domain-containing protein [Pelomonas sp. CA6]
MDFKSLMRRRDWMAAGLLACCGSPVSAQGEEPQLSGFTESLAPLNYEEHGQPRGFSVELLEMVAEQAGLKLSVQVLPWLRSVQMARGRPNSLLFSLTRTAEREDQYRWVGPISERRLLIYQMANQPALKLRSLDALGTRKLGVVRESAAARELQAAGLRPDRELELAQDDGSNLRKLLAGRMDLMLMLDWAAAWHLNRQGLSYNSLRVVMAHDVGKSYWYGLPPDTDPALVTRLQQALDQIRRNSRYERLRQRYFR